MWDALQSKERTLTKVGVVDPSTPSRLLVEVVGGIQDYVFLCPDRGIVGVVANVRRIWAQGKWSLVLAAACPWDCSASSTSCERILPGRVVVSSFEVCDSRRGWTDGTIPDA